MTEYMQMAENSDEEQTETEQGEPDPHLMLLSAAALNTELSSPKTMQLQVTIQGQPFLFLVDSGSSACFIDNTRAQSLLGSKLLPKPVHVKVAGGALLQSTLYFPNLEWSTEETTFTDAFRVLELGSYDGIIGLDWLAKYSPMLTHWGQSLGAELDCNSEGSPNSCAAWDQNSSLHTCIARTATTTRSANYCT